MADYDMEDDVLDPTVIQAPGWAKEDGHDLPIFPEKAAIHDELRVVLDAAPFGPDHALIRERIGKYDSHIPIYPGLTGKTDHPRSITDRSYFGAVLMALFDLSPFLNFIEEAVNSKAYSDPIFVGLHSLAQAFRRRGCDRMRDEELKQEVWSHLSTLWSCIKIKAEGENQAEPFEENFCHALKFTNYLLRRLEHAQLQQGEAGGGGGGGDDVNLSIRFKQLFTRSTIRLAPMRCACAQPVLRRQPTSHPQTLQTPGYVLEVIVTEGMHLEQAISRAMWEEKTKSTDKPCPACGTEVHANAFNTFAYLPEVFFILPHFMSKRYKEDDVRYTVDEKFVYPERLDMSGLTDNSDRQCDQVDTIYKLQSIITCTDQSMDWRTQYKPALRVSENNWVQYGYGEVSRTKWVTFEEIIDPNNRETVEEAPHLLMYVRERRTRFFGTLPDAVKNRQFPIEHNTAIHDKYGLQSSVLGRFVEAQDQPGENGHATAFESARSELANGRKTSHWMWFMFPQVYEWGWTRLTEFFAIKCLGEAIGYWNHPQLKGRYLDLLRIVLESSQTDLSKLFGSWYDAHKFRRSLSLFALVCDDEERDVFEQAFDKFGIQVYPSAASELLEWLRKAGEDEACKWVRYYAGIPADQSDGDDGNEETEVPERGGLSALVTSPESLAYNKDGKKAEDPTTAPQSENDGRGCDGSCSGADAGTAAAQNLYLELMKLSNTRIDDSGEEREQVRIWNQRAVGIGSLLLGYAVPKGAPAPAVTPEHLEAARLLGRHVMQLSRLKPEATELSEAAPGAQDHLESESVDDGFDTEMDGSGDGVVKDEDFKPIRGFLPEDDDAAGDFPTSADSFGLDGNSDELAEDGHLDEQDLHEAVAIPTDPNDPRIEACQTWTLDHLKAEFQKEQLDMRGLRNDTKRHRMKFLKHFELERDYSIYHENRLRQAVEERGIVMSNGASRADKAELVDALTEYDTQRLGDMEFVEGEDTDQTDSAEFEAEEYQSSDSPETDGSSAKEATPRPTKRPLYEYKEDDDEILDGYDDEGDDYGDEDYHDDGDGDAAPRGPPKGPVRRRARFY